MGPGSPLPQEICYLAKNEKNIKREKLLQILGFESEVLEFFAYDRPLQLHTVPTVNTKNVTAMAPRLCDSQRLVGVFAENGMLQYRRRN